MRVIILFVLFHTVYFLAAYFRVQSNFENISVGLLLFILEKIEVGSQIIYADFQEFLCYKYSLARFLCAIYTYP